MNDKYLKMKTPQSLETSEYFKLSATQRILNLLTPFAKERTNERTNE